MNKKLSKIAVLTAFAFIGNAGYSQDAGKKKAPLIDLSHWSVTVPAENPKKPGKPLEFGYPEILNYANNPALNKYMYNDEKDKSIVFYAFPSGTTTPNSHYSRSELRETIESGNNDVNWTFAEGGILKGTFAVAEVSKNKDGQYSSVIIAQIHGRLTNEQQILIKQKDKNAPPILKIYWYNGKIRVKTKILKNLNASEKEILAVKAWGDDTGKNFKEKVGFNKFTIEIKVSDGRMEVILNGKESLVYNDINIKKWGIFENYFKAGNYFQSNEPNTYAKVKIYSLVTSH